MFLSVNPVPLFRSTRHSCLLTAPILDGAILTSQLNFVKLTMAPKLEEKSRTGRDNQRELISHHPRYLYHADGKLAIGYGADGERLVAGLVPLSADKKQVLLIQSTRRNGWVVPKGGWETDEKTAEDAACREAWEEAGIICKVLKDLGKIPDRRGADELTKHAPRATFQFFEATVQKEEAKWPEMQKRDRKWMTYTEAKAALAARPELLEALNRSSIVR